MTAARAGMIQALGRRFPSARPSWSTASLRPRSDAPICSTLTVSPESILVPWRNDCRNGTIMVGVGLNRAKEALRTLYGPFTFSDG
jgi:hypothetical protein